MSRIFEFAALAAAPSGRTLTPGPSPFPSRPPSQGEGNPRPFVIQPFLLSPSSPGVGGWEGTGEERRGDEGLNAGPKESLTP